ncbi:heptosyltransferase-2 [Ulvibacter sp. MAR_2010_11]|uniref:glycosyltransferase family 9 protein n=1 Tax=Ulvibacter sp. MAR_2010_11 TaxID=1250229 RepID=UPI000C2B5908|nr:glycosyltransferase family 9 protein [Ulvibacter sp. MAR_2010_11]PKA83761.1 heptosyltransferase-2 [Ulvibacter sp. MAR_2010_11]
MKILVIQHKMIGDVLTTSLLFEALRSHFPEAQLDYLINSNTQPVIAYNPFIDKLWLFSKEMEASKSLYKSFRKSIKDEKYDVVIDVYAKLRSAFLAKHSGAKKRISYRKWYTKHLYTHTFTPRTISVLDEGLAIENRIMLLEPLIDKIKSIPKPTIYLTSEELYKGKEILKHSDIEFEKPLYMVGITGSSDQKTYPLPYMATLLDALVHETDGQLLFNYIPDQQNEADMLYSMCSEKTQQHIFKEVYGNDLREFLGLTAHCDALIGNEGGAVNMAKALNIPTFSIFAPWILKEAWNSYEASGKNMSVHLKDFFPKIYTKHPKKYKNQAANLYKQLSPDYIIPELKNFLSNFSS